MSVAVDKAHNLASEYSRVLSPTALKMLLLPARHPQHSAFGVGGIIWAYPSLEPLPIC